MFFQEHGWTSIYTDGMLGCAWVVAISARFKNTDTHSVIFNTDIDEWDVWGANVVAESADFKKIQKTARNLCFGAASHLC